MLESETVGVEETGSRQPGSIVVGRITIAGGDYHGGDYHGGGYHEGHEEHEGLSGINAVTYTDAGRWTSTILLSADGAPLTSKQNILQQLCHR